jgi:hypothetical protein
MTLSPQQPSGSGTGAAEYASLGIQSIAIVYLVSVAALGTGGVAGVDWRRANSRTGPFTIVRETESASDEAFTTADRVLLLRRWFSLSVAETARALHVQRPTVYSWQDGKAPAAPKHLERLRLLFDFAREWRAMSADPLGNQRKEPLGPGGRTLVDLLSVDEIPRAQIMETLNRIAEAIARQRAHGPASGAELAKRFGFKPLSDSEIVENVAQESSRGSRKTGRS